MLLHELITDMGDLVFFAAFINEYGESIIDALAHRLSQGHQWTLPHDLFRYTV